MGRRALGTILVITWACAEPAVADGLGEGVPFTAGELATALAARGIELHGTVRLVAPTTIEVTTPDGRQHVELGGAHGPAAARLVALHLVESVDALEVPAPPAPPTTRQLAIASGLGRGTSAIDLTLLALRTDATWGRGRWRWGGSLGWLHGLAKAEDPAQPVTANLVVARVVGGVAAGRFELVGGPAVVAYRGVAAGVTWGAGGGVRARLAGTARWSAIASCDADVLGHRVVVAFDGVEFAATPRVALTAALGIRWEGR